MCFVQTPEMWRLIAGEQPGGNSMSRACIGKRKFVDRHYLKKIVAPPSHYGEAQNYPASQRQHFAKPSSESACFSHLVAQQSPFRVILLQNVNAAEDVNLIFVNGNI